MKKRRGVALPAAVMLCSFLLIVSFGVSSFVIVTATNNRVGEVFKNRRIAFLQSHEQYFNSMDFTLINDTTLTYKVFNKEDNDSIRALCAYLNTGELVCYAIYDFTDFDERKVLAYQTDNLYVLTIEQDQYVGGLVKITGE